MEDNSWEYFKIFFTVLVVVVFVFVVAILGAQFRADTQKPENTILITITRNQYQVGEYNITNGVLITNDYYERPHFVWEGYKHITTTLISSDFTIGDIEKP